MAWTVHNTELHPFMASNASVLKALVNVMTSRVAALRTQADHLETALARIQPGDSWQDAAHVTPAPDVTYMGRLAYLKEDPLGEGKPKLLVHSAPGLFCWAPGLGWRYADPKSRLDVPSDVSLQLWVPEPPPASAIA